MAAHYRADQYGEQTKKRRIVRICTVRDVSGLLIFFGRAKTLARTKKERVHSQKGGQKLLDIVGNFPALRRKAP
jgi:hypothetical protein